MHRFVDSIGAPSVAVAVAKDGRIVWEEAIGWASREKQIPSTVHTMYALASISKPITATGLMTLVERGQLDLDRPVNLYLGPAKLTGLAGDANAATVRGVLSHTAGLPLHTQLYYADRDYSPTSMEETIRRYGVLVFPPGQVFEYSNLGYGILDYLIERVSGRRYADFMRTEVFLPLGLTHTSIDIPPGLEHLVAERYDSRQQPIPSFRFDHPGASAVYSSAHDLIRFAMFHLKNRLPGQRRILEDSTIDSMHRVVPPSEDYALGFSVRDGGYRLAHTGGMPGAATLMVLYPTRNVALVVLANTSTRQAAVEQEFAIAREIAGAVLPGDGNAASVGRPTPASSSGPRTSTGSPELVGEWSGMLRTWQRAVPMRLSIAADGAITAWIGDQPGAALTNAAFQNGRLSGNVAARIPTDDAGRWPHALMVGLVLRAEKLAGEVVATSMADRIYFSLASYAELTKK